MYVLIIYHSGSSSFANDLSLFFHIYYALIYVTFASFSLLFWLTLALFLHQRGVKPGRLSVFLHKGLSHLQNHVLELFEECELSVKLEEEDKNGFTKWNEIFSLKDNLMINMNNNIILCMNAAHDFEAFQYVRERWFFFFITVLP